MPFSGLLRWDHAEPNIIWNNMNQTSRYNSILKRNTYVSELRSKGNIRRMTKWSKNCSLKSFPNDSTVGKIPFKKYIYCSNQWKRNNVKTTFLIEADNESKQHLTVGSMNIQPFYLYYYAFLHSACNTGRYNQQRQHPDYEQLTTPTPKTACSSRSSHTSWM